MSWVRIPLSPLKLKYYLIKKFKFKKYNKMKKKGSLKYKFMNKYEVDF